MHLSFKKRIKDPRDFQDEALVKLGPLCGKLYDGLNGLADREGLLKDSPALIKGIVFPFEPKVNPNDLLNKLVKTGHVARYELDGGHYIWLPYFKERQRIHPNEAQSVIPFDLNVIKFHVMVHEKPATILSKGKGKGKGKGEENVVAFNDIIDDLNLRAGTNYKSSSEATRAVIRARWNEGFKLEDFRTVHKKKCAEWLDTEMSKFLRPSTLYSNKFEGYLNQQEITKDGKAQKRSWRELQG